MAARPGLAALGDAPLVQVRGGCETWAAWAARELGRDEAVLLVATDDETAYALARDVAFFVNGTAHAAQVAVLTASADPYAELHPDRVRTLERVTTLWRLTQPTSTAPNIVVASVPGLMQKTMPREAWQARCHHLAVGDAMARDALCAELVAWGYERTPIVDEPGTFAVRGGVLDVYPPHEAQPVRIELFGDAIESLRAFDPESQRTLRLLPDVALYPIRETIPTGRDPWLALRELADTLTFPTRATRTLWELLEANHPTANPLPLLPAYHGELVAPLALVRNHRLVIWAADELGAAVATHAEHILAQHHAATAHGRLVYPPDALFATVEEFQADVRAHRVLAVPRLERADATWLAGGVERGLGDEAARTQPLVALRMALSQARQAHDQALGATLAHQLQAWLDQGATVLMACDSQARLDRVSGLLASHKLPQLTIAAGHALEPTPGHVVLTRHAPREGMIALADGVVVLTAADVFGEAARPPRPKAPRAGFARIASAGELRPGDLIVHQRHGVGRYLGLATATVGGVGDMPVGTQEMLLLEYADGKLYLPVYRTSEIDRYIGGETSRPRLDKMGGTSWLATTRKVSVQVRALAEELLQLYAQRASLQGEALRPEPAAYDEFAASFPYVETPDQAAAIEAVLTDMASPKPMDRLVCGDVGYGKTEVALRAIFACVLGGKQAVLLAPTTVLVEQHARTLRARFSEWPITVDTLSRFQSKKAQAEVVNRLAAGRLDVVIATHRALSPDVRFAKLGLIVVDEEQRFGVAHKERLKKLRANIDVLTLTATPIPRTLHLAMTGLRDMSIIATPPTDRRAVQTYVSGLADQVIREAIEAEFARGGQVYWITRHIEAGRPVDATAPDQQLDRPIATWQRYLQALVPTARIGIAHGQLGAEALEAAMLAFVNGETNLLIATTIVESGLDIPRANTMFIVRADAFGLAQLYQLRGRVGRSDKRAACYLLVPTAQLSEDAAKRLDTLLRFAELGAGFAIASADLELRGGGELLGAKQSGSIAAVGFDAYVKMLEHAVAELRGEPLFDPVDPELTTGLPGFLPDTYMPDPAQRLELYQRLARAPDDDAIATLADELADRFGPLPEEAARLIELMGVKALARQLGLIAVEVTPSRLAIAFPAQPALPTQAHVAQSPGWKRGADGRYSRTLESPGGAARAKTELLALLAHGTHVR